jgi:hypothetical protein
MAWLHQFGLECNAIRLLCDFVIEHLVTAAEEAYEIKELASQKTECSRQSVDVALEHAVMAFYVFKTVPEIPSLHTEEMQDLVSLYLKQVVEMSLALASLAGGPGIGPVGIHLVSFLQLPSVSVIRKTKTPISLHHLSNSLSRILSRILRRLPFMHASTGLVGRVLKIPSNTGESPSTLRTSRIFCLTKNVKFGVPRSWMPRSMMLFHQSLQFQRHISRPDRNILLFFAASDHTDRGFFGMLLLTFPMSLACL